MSDHSDTYLNSLSNRSVMCTFKAFAINSKVSILGIVNPLQISEMVDLGMPVMIESCLYDIFRLYIISPIKIFMEIIFDKTHHYIQTCFW